MEYQENIGTSKELDDPSIEWERFHRDKTIHKLEFLREMYKHFTITNYETKAHEVGHILAKLCKIPYDDPNNEGIAQAYGFKGSLMGILNKKLPLKDTIEVIRFFIGHYKYAPKYDIHRNGFEMVLGHDFYIPEIPSEPEIYKLVKELDEKISLALHKDKKEEKSIAQPVAILAGLAIFLGSSFFLNKATTYATMSAPNVLLSIPLTLIVLFAILKLMKKI